MLPASINSNVVEAAMQVEGGKYYSSDAQHSNYLLVQFETRLHPRIYEEIHSLNLYTIRYLSGNTYLCYYESADLDLVRTLSSVVYANVYHSDYVIQQHLKHQVNQDLQTSSSASDHSYHVNITLHSPDLVAQATPHIAEILQVPETALEFQDTHLFVDLTPHQFRPIAALKQVLSIQGVKPLTPQIFQARQDIGLPRDSMPRFFNRRGIFSQYRGEGQVIAIADSGINGGYSRFKKADVGFEIRYMGADHPAFGNRLLDSVGVYERIQPETLESIKREAQEVLTRRRHGPARTVDDIITSLRTSDVQTSHGTHVASCAVGKGFSFRYCTIQGPAPKASIIMYCLSGFNGEKNKDQNIFLLLQRAYNHPKGPRIHNNSVAPSTFGRGPTGYDDNRAHGADDFVWQHQDMLVIVAAGNLGRVETPFGQIEGFAVAKNILTVGACESSHPLEWAPPRDEGKRDDKGKKDDEEKKDDDNEKKDDDEKKDDQKTWHLRYRRRAPHGNTDNVAYFSNRGPAYTGDASVDQPPFRWKPDVVAPGVAILGAKASGRPGSGSAFGTSASGDYFFDSGTSMATPIVAGAAALIRQAVLKGTGRPTVSAALIKAIIINTTDDISNVAGPPFTIPNRMPLVPPSPPSPPPSPPPDSGGTTGTGGTGTDTDTDTGTAGEVDPGIGLGLFPHTSATRLVTTPSRMAVGSSSPRPAAGTGGSPARPTPPNVNPAPDAYQGFGRINVLRAMELVTRKNGDFLDYNSVKSAARVLPTDPEAPDSGGEHTIPIPATGTSTLAVTMCYTDQPGKPLMNVLSLQATHSSGPLTRYGNDMACQGLPRPSGVADTSNNVQKIVWSPVPAGGTVTAKVSCSVFVPSATIDFHYAIAWSITTV